eukprot:TRINITY_DN1965_c0_g1_i1.p1 TRINITY_DN1965_c0_g1~~TRINITY_DN1965_c0_g1_i1.p1  ORF type:complete len:108 (-),score=14.76 TRINITY_DN1965_c0_g1_i1:347-670(-)
MEATTFTIAELKKYNGGPDSSGKIYVALKGVVYDVSAKADLYGPGGSYHSLAGNDGSRALAIMNLDDTSNHSLEGLSEEELQTLDAWIQKFASQYQVVGMVKTGSSL